MVVGIVDMSRAGLQPVRPAGGYLPIADYGVIGNLRTAALVGRDGSIDWCCLPELDSPSVFGALLDRMRGGCFRIAPAGLRRSAQRYLPETNVLETRLEGEGGTLCLLDFMPLRGSLLSTEDPQTEPQVHRLARCDEGEVVLELAWSPRFDYARRAPALRRVNGGVIAEAGERLALGAAGGMLDQASLAEDGPGPVVRLRRRLGAGEEAAFVTRFGTDDASYDSARARRALDETVAAWRGWVEGSREIREWQGPWREPVVRSELALKLLTHPDSGAIAAAATTSLPEVIGGVRNWDYRFSWLRDAAFTVQALMSLGHLDEAKDFFEWLEKASMLEDQAGGLRTIYGLHGETRLPERVLEHLEGYRGSRPVRIGNLAAGQTQHDIYGELLDVACEFVRRGHVLDAEEGAFLSRVADRACHAWRQPDEGIWEVRNGPRHFVHSKVMCWVALARALELAGHGDLTGDVGLWRREAQAIREVVLAEGFDTKQNSFVQSFGSPHLDAANLLIPLVEFLPVEDPRVQATIDRTRQVLLRDGLVRRYDSDDGLPGTDGGFGVCTSWLIDTLALSGRGEEARELFAEMVGRASPLGLYSEEWDLRTGELLGNFPQAFTHIGLINSALYLARGEGRPVPFVPEEHGAKGERPSPARPA
jgi:GH15 family glucan-1,4-alpha-glucosidase